MKQSRFFFFLLILSAAFLAHCAGTETETNGPISLKLTIQDPNGGTEDVIIHNALPEKASELQVLNVIDGELTMRGLGTPPTETTSVGNKKVVCSDCGVRGGCLTCPIPSNECEGSDASCMCCKAAPTPR